MKLLALYYLVNSDNLEDAIITAADYERLTLEMSTGDFHVHTAIPINRELTDEEESKFLDIEWEN